MSARSLIDRISTTRTMARLARTAPDTGVEPSTVVVLPLDERTRTSPVAAATAIIADAILPHPVAVMDLDGAAQPMRGLLGSPEAGDLVGLSVSVEAGQGRRAVEDFVDMNATVPLASTWIRGAGALPPETVWDGVWRLKRRFPSVIIDVPVTVPPETIAHATSLATHVVLVTDQHGVAHDWLHSGQSLLSGLARAGRITVAVIGGTEKDRTRCPHGDIVPLGDALTSTYDKGRMALTATTPGLLAPVYELTTRAFTRR